MQEFFNTLLNQVRNFAAYGAMADTYKEFEKGERHGSYEGTWSRPQDNGFVSFVTLAITPEQVSSRYRVEIWMGAEYNERFVRHLVTQFSGVKPQNITEELMQTKISRAVTETAKQFADDLKPEDLTNVRSPHRTPVKKISEAGPPPD